MIIKITFPNPLHGTDFFFPHHELEMNLKTKFLKFINNSKAKDKSYHAPGRVWISDEKLLVFSSLISPSKSVCLKFYVKHSSQCFITISKTSKSVKNTSLRVVFSTLFSVFDM